MTDSPILAASLRGTHQARSLRQDTPLLPPPPPTFLLTTR